MSTPGRSAPEATGPLATTRVVVVTGLSGAGKSTALAALEDLGFHSIENLPPSLTVHAIEACEAAGVRKIALGFGGSVGAFLDDAREVLAAVATDHRAVTVVFLDASDDVVLRRFNETRRPHPEAQRGAKRGGATAGVLDAVRLERERLASVRTVATHVIDTSGLSVHDLRRRIFGLLAPEQEGPAKLSVRVLSFGFKYGLPSDADLVLDVRFLDNPHFVPELRHLTGEDRRVQDYVLRAEGAREFVEKATDLLAFLLPRYADEGKSYLTIAVGCTGGQHRSITIANALAGALREIKPASRRARAPAAFEIAVVHRDIRASEQTAPAAGGAKAEGA